MEYKDLEFITPEKKVGIGSTAKCYLLKNNKVFKEFHHPYDLGVMKIYKELSKFKSDSILFPEELVYDDLNFYGYVTGYAKGKMIGTGFSNIDLDLLSKQSIKLESDIKDISQEKLIMDDLYEGNIMYDGENIKVIDTDYYDIFDNLSKEEAYFKNLSYYKRTIYHLLSDNLEMCLTNNFILEKVDKYRTLKLTGSELLNNILLELQKEYGNDVKSIADANKKIR